MSNIKKRLNSENFFDDYIRLYIKTFYDATPDMPGYDLILNGQGIANLGNYHAQADMNLENSDVYEADCKELISYMFNNYYADMVPKTKSMLVDFFKRIYAKDEYYTFDNSYRYSIDSDPGLRAISDEIDELPKDLLAKHSKLIEKRDTFYKSHILSINIAPYFRGKFVKQLFEELNDLNEARVFNNIGYQKNKPLARMTVQIPKLCNVDLNERDSVTVMCNTRDLEDVVKVIGRTFEALKPHSYIMRGEPNKLLYKPFNYVGYDSFDTDFGMYQSEILGEIVVKAIDLVISKNKKYIPNNIPKYDMTYYRQQCLSALIKKSNKYYYDVIKNVKKIIHQKAITRWNVALSYDVDPNMLFVAPQLRDAIESICGKKHKIISSKEYKALDKQRVRKYK